MQHSHEITPEMQDCLQNCIASHALCIETAQHCLRLGGPHADVKHQRLLMDCAQICQTSADFMLRTSHYHHLTCGVCAEICKACAEDCQEMDPEDPMMRRCGEACKRCAESCERMAQG